MQNRITEYYFMVGDIEEIETAAKTIYFEGYGNEEKVNPFYSHHYKARFDGSRQQLLTPEEANHSISMSDTRNYFVQNYSRPDLPTTAVLRDKDGDIVMELEEVRSEERRVGKECKSRW